MTAPAPATSAGNPPLTAVLRPVGVLSGGTLDRLADHLMSLAERVNLVVLNLVAASIPTPAVFAAAMRRPGAALSAPDRCLLLVGAGDDVLRELALAGGEIATIQPPAPRPGTCGPAPAS